MNNFIKSLMDEKGLKQKELAAILGISPAAVSQWNEEGTNISVEYLFSLSKIFHITVDELLDGKRAGESLEDKWKREYEINEEAAKDALYEGKKGKDKALRHFAALQRADTKFFDLFEKIIEDTISKNERREWEYLKQFYDINIHRSCLLNGVVIGRNDDFLQKVLDMLKNKLGTNESIIWELKKIYNITHYGVGIKTDYREIAFEDDYDNEGFLMFGGEEVEDDEEIFYAVYSVLPSVDKDRFLMSRFIEKKDSAYLYKLIEHGGNILYSPDDINLAHYEREKLDGLAGEIKPVSELVNAQSVIYALYDNYSAATFEQYQALINRPAMKRIEMEAKYKEKNPIKYWEFIKQRRI